MKQQLHLPDGSSLAYVQRKGRLPGVVFLGGFMADMNGTKATYLDEFCQEKGQTFIRFDYFGHGESSGQLIDSTIGRWKQDVLAILDNLTEGPQILVGSSMGGWLMLLAARERPKQVKALLGIAPAPDFIKPLVWDRLTSIQREEIETKGVCYVPSPFQAKPYPISRVMIEEGRQHELLGAPIAIDCPVRLLHGIKDIEVPYSFSEKLMEDLVSEDVRLNLIKNGDHRLNSEDHLKLLGHTLLELFV